MAEAFALENDETIIEALLCTWYKGFGGLDNQTGQMLLTNKRMVFCARNQIATALITGPALDMMLRSTQVRWQLRISQIDKIIQSKRLGFKTQFTVSSKLVPEGDYTFVFNPGKKNSFITWAQASGLAIN